MSTGKRRMRGMSGKDAPTLDATPLRRGAEEVARVRAAESPQAADAMSPDQIRQTLHELRVHQIELEMQNEELRRAQEALDAARARYFDLYDLAPVGYATISKEGLILEVNFTAAMLLGVDRSALVRQPLSRFVLKADQDVYYGLRKELHETGAPQSCELRMLKGDGAPFWAHLQASANQDVEAGPVYRVVVSDITELRRVQEALIVKESTIASSLNAIALSDFEGRLTYVNSSFLEMWGYGSESEVLGRQATGFWRSETQARDVLEAVRSQGSWSGEMSGTTRDGKHFDALLSAHLVRAGDGRSVCIAASFMDITARKQAEGALRESEVKLKAVFEILPVGVSILDAERTISFMNAALARILDVSREELAIGADRGRTYLRPDGTPRPVEEFPSVLALKEQRAVQDVEIGVVKEDRSVVWTSVSAVPVAFLDWKVVVVTTDITARRRAEEALRTSLVEKEVLLREVHHRVKNNLASVIALINMQQEANAGLAVTAGFTELSGRIRSMALVHELLMSSKTLSRIDLQDYFEKLVSRLHSSYQVRAEVTLSVVAAGVEMDLGVAIPCGLIVTELVTNAFKHAFPEGHPRPGECACCISVTAAWDGAAYTLTVSDNGVGMPADLDWTATTSLGLQLVILLGQGQLHGDIEMDRIGGTTFRLRFAPERRA